MTILLGGCAGHSDLPARNGLPSPAAEYRRLVAQSPQILQLRRVPSFGHLEIAPLRKAVAPQPGDWMTCIKTTEVTNRGTRSAYFGVFLQDWNVVEVRRGILIDGCDAESYQVLHQFPPAVADAEYAGGTTRK